MKIELRRFTKAEVEALDAWPNKLIAAGYRPEQILRCPMNDAAGKCPCDLQGPQKECGLTYAKEKNST